VLGVGVEDALELVEVRDRLGHELLSERPDESLIIMLSIGRWTTRGAHSDGYCNADSAEPGPVEVPVQADGSHPPGAVADGEIAKRLIVRSAP